MSRPDLHTVEVSLPETAVWNRRPARFLWNAQTSFEEEGHPDCPTPDPFPPEHFVGTCWDGSEWQAHRRTR